MYTFAHYVYPKSVPSFNDNGIVEMKLREVNVHFCTLCIPKKCAFFLYNGFIGSKLEKLMYTFAHYVHPKSVPSFCTMDL